MENKRDRIAYKAVCSFFMLILLIYPLRHVQIGVDLWDGGYNYANFRYSGLECMDSMWFFATWLANSIGSLFTRMPFGNTCVGMNIYTGLVVSFLAATAFLFCVRRLKMPAWMVFVAEILAISLCWAPTAMLYSYLTYAFLLVGTILLYKGILSGQYGYLIAAGVVLGFNVGNRFSNLVQTGLILAVWIYGFLQKKKFKKVLQETGWCVLGYVSALVAFLSLMAFKYGLGNYVEGVLRLFQMTENAEDYTPGRMLLGMVWAYYDCTYFLKRFGLAVVCGLVVCVILPKKWAMLKRTIVIFFTILLCVWLSRNLFYSRDFATYNSVYYPCVTVLTMTLVLSAYNIVDKKAAKEDKLLAILLILTILITSLGGNNAIYASINNLFLVLPGFLWMVWKFCREREHICYFPFKAILIAGLFFLTVQGVQFGWGFVYEEAGGGRNLTAGVQDVPALAGMVTSPEKAEALTELYHYIKEKKLDERECVLYGHVPGLSFYMEMTPAMNVWSDLRSYDYDVMKQDLYEIEGRPVILLSAECGQYVTDRDGTNLFWDVTAQQKMDLLCSYIEERGYRETFRNEEFVVYE